MSTTPPTRAPRPQGDPVLESWDLGLRRMFGFMGALIYVLVLGFLVLMGGCAIAYLFAGEPSIGLPFVFWFLVVLWIVQRLARRRRRT